MPYAASDLISGLAASEGVNVQQPDLGQRARRSHDVNRLRNSSLFTEPIRAPRRRWDALVTSSIFETGEAGIWTGRRVEA